MKILKIVMLPLAVLVPLQAIPAYAQTIEEAKLLSEQRIAALTAGTVDEAAKETDIAQAPVVADEASSFDIETQSLAYADAEAIFEEGTVPAPEDLSGGFAGWTVADYGSRKAGLIGGLYSEIYPKEHPLAGQIGVIFEFFQIPRIVQQKIQSFKKFAGTWSGMQQPQSKFGDKEVIYVSGDQNAYQVRKNGDLLVFKNTFKQEDREIVAYSYYWRILPTLTEIPQLAPKEFPQHKTVLMRNR